MNPEMNEFSSWICLYMADVGSFLENHPSRIKLQGAHISGLLYDDDLILIGKTPEDAKIFLSSLNTRVAGRPSFPPRTHVHCTQEILSATGNLCE